MSRVLIVWQGPHPGDVRIEKFSRTFVRAGMEVIVLCRAKGEELAREQAGSETILRVGHGLPAALSAPIPLNPLWRRAMVAAIKEFSPGLILVRDIPLAGLAARIAHRHGLKCVMDVAEHYPESMRSWKKYSTSWLSRKLVHEWRVPDHVERDAVKHVDAFVTVCQESSVRLYRDFGIPLANCSIVGNTPETAALLPPKPRGARRVFGYHGILCADRNLDTLLAGFDLAAEEFPDIELLLCGGGELEAPLREQAAKCRHARRIRFTGRYRLDELEGLYAQCDFGIVSVEINAATQVTLPNKLFDYAARGIPVVVVGTDPIRRVMQELQSGVVCGKPSRESWATAMRKLLQSDIERFAQAGVDAVRSRYNWEHDGEILVSTVRKLMLK
ncbi:MAG: glycosyltransferase [Bdellovibrionales bacterium]|nr:glycosyltransferase [Bdellovibrionales bacterium]